MYIFALFNLKKPICILFFLIAVLHPAISQVSNHITTSQGLGTNMLTTIIRDRNNYMWICSYNGLFKHEGSDIRNFKKSTDTTRSISAEEMHGIFEDRYGSIWTGTTAGVDKIDPVSGKVQHYNLRNPDNLSTHVGYITSIFQDNKDAIWIGTDVALFKLNYTTGNYKVLPVTKDEKGIVSHYMGYRPSVETKDGLWLSTDEGLMFYEYASEKFYHRYYNPDKKPVFNMAPPFKYSNGNSAEMCSDAKGNLYFITGGNLLGCYNPVTNKLDSFRFEYPPGAWQCCNTMCADDFDNIWIGFRHGGLLVFNHQTKSFLTIQKKEINSLISSNYISSVAKDYQGKMWVTTENGLHIIDLYNKGVQQIAVSNRPDFEPIKYQSGIISIDKQDNVYIPYFRGGIITFNAVSQFVQYTSAADTTIGKTSFIYPDDKNNLWLAANSTFIQRTSLQNNKNGRQKLFALSDSLQVTSSNAVWMFKSPDNSYYIKKGNGWWYHVTANGVKSFSGIGFMKQGCVSKDSQALWYIAGDLNLARRDFKTEKTDTVFLQTLLKQTNFYFTNPRDIVDDGNGSIWVTSQNGLLQYDTKKKQITIHTSADGLSHSFTHALYADEAQRVWVLSLGGVDCYDPDTKKFRNVTNFSSGKYMDAYGSSVSTSDGRICFVTGNKVVLIDPAIVFNNSTTNTIIRLHEMQINNEPVNPNDSLLLMQLPWQKNRLFFRFGLLEFDDREKVLYAYRLDGLNPDWISIASRNEIQFDALSAGSYTLQIKATTGNGKDYLYQLSFRIKSPWWQTWWFRIFAISIIALLIYYLFRRRIKTIQNKAAIQQQLAELEAKAIRAQMNPHFIFNSLNAIQETIITEKVDAAYDYLSRFSKLLRMVLDNSEKNFISLNSELETIRLYLSLEALRFSQSFTYSIELDEDLDKDDIFIPPLLLQPFVENAIWHGLISKEGEKKLVLQFEEKQGNLLCIIHDNGIGRERSAEIKKQKLGANRFESKGTKLVLQRVEILNREKAGSANIETIDLYDEAGNAAGTKVIVTLATDFKTAKLKGK